MMAPRAFDVATGATISRSRRWLAFVILLIGALMDLVDATIVNVALPTVRIDLTTSDTALEWIASGYFLTFAVTLITAGRLGDRIGHKRLFLAGVGLFGLASLSSGLAHGSTQLIVARLVQGLAAGVMVPQVLATARNLFEGRERASVLAVYGAIAGLAVAAGLTLGGLLVNANLFGLSWRTVFLVNVPVAMLVVVAGLSLIPETRDPSAPRTDLPGTFLLTIGLSATVYSLVEGRGLRWPAWLWIVLFAGLVALALLPLVEKRLPRQRAALMPTALFQIPAFAAGTLIQLLFSASMAGFFFVLTIWLQAGEGFTPLLSGITACAFSAGTILFANLPQRLVSRHGRNVLVVGGLLMAGGIGGVIWPAVIGGAPINGWTLVPGLVIAGAGLALLVIPLSNVVISAVPAQSAGGASGVLSTAQQLGGAIGIGIVGQIFFTALRTSGFRQAFEGAAPWVAVGFIICAVLSLTLPRKAVAATYR